MVNFISQCVIEKDRQYGMMKPQYSDKRTPIRQNSPEPPIIQVNRVKYQKKASITRKGDSSFMQKVHSVKKKPKSPTKKCPSPNKQYQPLLRCSTSTTTHIKPDPQIIKKPQSQALQKLNEAYTNTLKRV